MYSDTLKMLFAENNQEQLNKYCLNIKYSKYQSNIKCVIKIKRENKKLK